MIDRKLQLLNNTTFLLISSIFLQSFSFLSIKYSTMQAGLTVFILLGIAFIFLGARAIVWQMLLNFVELSKIYPYAALVQVLILLYSVILFHEHVTVYNLVGLILMLSGIYYMSQKMPD